MTKYAFRSPFKKYIEGMIAQKRALGYKYHGSSPRLLFQFDKFCLTQGCTEPVLSKELAHAWAKKRPHEAMATLHHRVGIVRQLALYMTRIGLHAYVFTASSLPNTHAVGCLKRWVVEGKDFMTYLPVLKTYLGHYSISDTARYLRLTAEAYPDITAKVEDAVGHVVPTMGGYGHETD